MGHEPLEAPLPRAGGEPATRMGVHPDMHTEISETHHFANTDDNHNTCDTTDEDPRSGKRRKPRSAPAVTAPLRLRLSPFFGSPSTTLPEMTRRSLRIISDLRRP
jgi:hypothetical protein